MARAADNYTIATTQTTRQRLPLARFSSAAESALRMLQVERAAISIAFVGETRMKKLATQRGKKHAANVLAFPYREGEQELMGDIIICVPVARAEAKKWGRTTHEHLVALLIHGIVHLTGRTHETDAKAEKMERIEKRLIDRISSDA